MKKFISLTLIIISIHALAQTQGAKLENQIDKDATELAQKLCGCIEEIIKEYHPTLRDLMKDMVEKGETEAQQKFTQKLLAMNADEQAKIMTDIERMQKFEDEMGEKCGTNLEIEYAQYNNNPEFETKMMDALKNLSECGFTYQMMLLGQKK